MVSKDGTEEGMVSFFNSFPVGAIHHHLALHYALLNIFWSVRFWHHAATVLFLLLIFLSRLFASERFAGKAVVDNIKIKCPPGSMLPFCHRGCHHHPYIRI